MNKYSELMFNNYEDLEEQEDLINSSDLYNYYNVEKEVKKRKTMEELEIESFKKSLFGIIRVFNIEKIMDLDDFYFSEEFWNSQLKFVLSYKPEDLIISKDRRRFEEFIIDCALDYKKREIDLEITPLYVLLNIMINSDKFNLNDIEKEKLKNI